MNSNAVSRPRHIFHLTALALAPIILSTLLSCNVEDTNCIERRLSMECMGFEPIEGALVVRVSISGTGRKIPIQIFENDFDEGQPILIDTLTDPSKEYILPIGDYSGTALYIEGNDTVLVVAGDDISTFEEETCDEWCWDVDEGWLDLRL